MWRILRVALIAGLGAVLTSCGGEDGNQGPDGGDEETLLSGADQTAWTFNDCFGDPLWENGVFRLVATPLDPPGCDAEPGGCWAIAGPIDLSLYSSARARFSVKLELGTPASGDGYAQANVMVLANAPGDPDDPGQPDVTVGNWSLDALGSESFEEDFDISLAGAMGLHTAHVQLHYNAKSADGICTDSAVVEIRDFRIVAQR